MQEQLMSKPSQQSRKQLEVTVMFEPHRLEKDLLQAAYAFLVPLPRRRLTAKPASPVTLDVQPPQGGERSVS
jgi:hypothetical protein